VNLLRASSISAILLAVGMMAIAQDNTAKRLK
jgi:hypothetical protein